MTVTCRVTRAKSDFAVHKQRMANNTLTLHYWGIKARGYLPAVIAAVGGVALEWNKNPDWPAFKPNCPFGQLPTLTGPDGFAVRIFESIELLNPQMGQSLAIVRYIARLAKLQGDSDKEFAQSEQLIQEGAKLLFHL